MIPQIRALASRWLSAIPRWRAPFVSYPDSFSTSFTQLEQSVIGLARDWMNRGEGVVLVSQFTSDFLRLEQALVALGLEFSVAPRVMDHADWSTHRLWLSLADPLREMRPPETFLRDRQAVERGFRLNFMVLQRHPLASEDQRLMAVLKQLPGPVRCGWFQSLDHPLLAIGVPPMLMEVLGQMGMHNHSLVSSRMLARRVEVTQRRVAAVVKQPYEPADSADEWLQRNLPLPLSPDDSCP